MSQSFSCRTISELSCVEYDAVIDLSDNGVVRQFAEFVRTLSATQRKAIWLQNVCPDQPTQAQYDNILTFLIMLFGKEQFPEEQELLISKLKQFITSPAFINIKNYIQFRFYPLSQSDFIQSDDYFGSMIDEYAKSQLAIKANDMKHFIHLIAPSDSFQSMSVVSNYPNLQSENPSLDSFDIDNLIYDKLEQKMNEMIEAKFSKIDEKLQNLTDEVEAIKKSINLNDDVKNNESDKVMKEINLLKDQMHKMQKKESTKKKRVSSNNLRRPKHKMSHSASASGKPHKSKNVYMLSMKQKNDKKEELRKWLADIGDLQVYFNLFIENGLYDLDIMKHVKMTDLALLGIANLADRVKIMQNIQRLKYRDSIEKSEAEIIYKNLSM